jgi:hypothetical protein
MHRIDDPRFLRAFCRLVSWPSRYLDGSVIVVNDTGPRLEVHILNGLGYSLVGIAWVRYRAVLLPGSSLLSANDLIDLDVAFGRLVRRFLQTHRFLGSGASTRRGAA